MEHETRWVCHSEGERQRGRESVRERKGEIDREREIEREVD